ncbi:nucleotidyltransferase family protein [Herbiconiux sp. P18]|uniref:nucleotidyltransferase family protein n=1 Tax=Herbiconiux liangxiaofengii TaxID=3342795 RepID=UPI0035BB1ADB
MPQPPAPHTVGVLLAAGAGRRMGRPKALVVGTDGEPWIVRGARVLLAGGCDEVLVVLGASAAEARELLATGGLGERVRATDARRWAEGLSASLAHGVAAAHEAGAEVALISLVDLPDLTPDAVQRLLAGTGPATLAQAFYDGRPSHPVAIGRDHLLALRDALTRPPASDRGARPYLVAHGAAEIDCTDLGGGTDVDRPTGPHPHRSLATGRNRPAPGLTPT